MILDFTTELLQRCSSDPEKPILIVLKDTRPFHTDLRGLDLSNCISILLINNDQDDRFPDRQTRHFDFVHYYETDRQLGIEQMSKLDEIIDYLIDALKNNDPQFDMARIRLAAMQEIFLLLAAKIRERHGIPGPKLDEVQRFTDKACMKKVASDGGLDAAKYIIATPKDLIEDQPKMDALVTIGFPIVAKPLNGAAGAGITKIEDSDQLNTWLHSQDPNMEYIFEEFIDGDLFRFLALVQPESPVQSFPVTLVIHGHNFVDGLATGLPASLVVLRDQHKRSMIEKFVLEEVIPVFQPSPGTIVYIQGFVTDEGTVKLNELTIRAPGRISSNTFTQSTNISPESVHIMAHIREVDLKEMAAQKNDQNRVAFLVGPDADGKMKELPLTLPEEGYVKDTQQPCFGVDDAMERIRPFGRYQWLLTFFYTYACFSHLCNMQFMAFGGTKPQFECCDNENKTSGHHPTDDCRAYYNCSRQNLSFTYDFYSIVEEWHLVCEESYVVSLITTIQMIGVLIGGLVAGPVTDLHGRKWTYFCILGLELTSGALSGLSTSWPMFAVFRFIIGFALGAALVTGWVFVAEMTTNRYRLIIRAAGGAFFAQFDEAMIGYLTKNWRWFSIIGNVQVLPLLILVAVFTYESPRWLVQKGRKAEAEEILRKMARFNKTSHLLPEKLFKPDPEPTYDSDEKAKPNRYFAWDLFRSRKLAIRTIVMVISYFSLATINYGMFFDIGDLPLNIYLTMTLLAFVGALELPVAILDARNTRLNRKYLLIGASSITVVANIAVTILQSVGEGAMSQAVYCGLISSISICGQLASNIAFDTAYMYSIELFPTLLRSNAGALCSLGARLGSILSPQLLYLEQYWTPLPYCAFSVIAGIGVLVDAIFLPNTKNLRLPETMTSANKLDN